ncbi:MAG: hypothetical protein QE494_05095 [Ramlibacter sp.]|uniref:hypothetical protein n=1 Tax=Ramlibacter sp. TaxID=1917967 RepID=UPI0026249880|nr:hypothetical protein [Ramlibacter sp.]MDH4375660.1 hypothetical protein [Ramlibacter sp.]
MNFDLIEEKLHAVLAEIVAQRAIALRFFSSAKQLDREMSLCSSFIDDCEAELAYTQIVDLLDGIPFTITRRSAVALIELALIYGLKTTDEEDRAFNFCDFSPFCFWKTPDLDGRLKISPLNKRQVTERIEAVLNLIDAQRNAFPPSVDPGRNLTDQLATIRDLLVSGELALAYEGCVCLLERCPIQVPASVAVGLIELALTFKFKTHRVEDAEYVWPCDLAPIP